MIYIDVERKMHTSEGSRKLEVCVEIPANELICLFGRSGSGKTTLLRMVAGLFNPDRGVIRIGKTTVFDSSQKINLPPQKRNIGFMFQDYALFPNMSVEENIHFGITDNDYSMADSLIEAFDLDALRRQKPDRLSGGQKQRVALARALVRRPEVLLLDEPLSALDFEMRHSLQNEIARAHRLLNATTLMVSHDKEEIKKLATSIIHIDNMKTNTLKYPTFW